MPVQINEMVIRANIVESHESGKVASEKSSNSSGSDNLDKSEIIKECADLVLEILNNKNQR